jgi:lysophospholipase L1-like esterase
MEESCMRKLNASWSSLLLLCTVGVGCAAETNGPDALGLDVEADTQALEKGRLLALGDSIAFGYNPFGDFTKDKNFSGYPEALTSEFSVKNSSCPGESTGSFLSATAPDFGCRQYRANYPLHVNYGNKPTQMDYALSRLTSSEPEDVPTQITLNLAGNDIFLAQAACQGDPTCFAQQAGQLITQIAQNTGMILGKIRNEGGYAGPITVMNLYATDYSVPSTIQFLTALNGAIAAVAAGAGAQVADAFGAFEAAAGSQSPCAAGLLIPNPNQPGTCDVHPSAAGQEVLADAVRDTL